MDVVLALGCIGAIVGPRRIFYAPAILSILGAGAAVYGTGPLGWAAWLTLGLGGVSFVLCVVAARMGAPVSEQSNPMNLPVFG